MATIATTFSLKDEMSQSLNNMNRLLTMLNSTLTATEGNAGKVGTAFDSIKKSSDGLGKLFNFNMATQAFNTVKGAVAGVVGKMEGLTATYQAQMDAEARLGSVMSARMGATSADLADMTKHIEEFSKTSVFGKTALTNAAQELGTYIESADTLKGLLPMLTNMSVQAGITSEQGLMSMSTMIGKVMAGDMGGLSKRGWTFTDSEKEAFKAMDEEQRLNFLIDAATKGIGNQDKAIAEMMANLGQQRELEELQIKVGGLLNPFMDAIGKAQLKLQIFFYKKLAAALQFAMKNINVVAKAILAGIAAIGTALLILAGYYLYVKRATIALQIANVKAALASAAAWAIANWQITLIILAIGVLIAVLVKLCGAANVVGAVFGGVFGLIKTVIVDCFKTAYNLVVPIINSFITVAEFFYNVWKHPIEAIKGLFYNLGSIILDLIGNAAGIIDMVLGTKLTEGVNNLKKGMENAKRSALGDDYTYFKQVDLLQTDGLVQGTISGAKSGINLANKFEQAIKGLPEAMTSGIQDSFNFDGEGNLETANQNKLQIDDDFKRLLSEKALQDYQVKYSQITPSVVIQSMEVSKEADEESVIDTITGAIVNAASACLSGAA